MKCKLCGNQILRGQRRAYIPYSCGLRFMRSWFHPECADAHPDRFEAEAARIDRVEQTKEMLPVRDRVNPAPPMPLFAGGAA